MSSDKTKLNFKVVFGIEASNDFPKELKEEVGEVLKNHGIGVQGLVEGTIEKYLDIHDPLRERYSIGSKVERVTEEDGKITERTTNFEDKDEDLSHLPEAIQKLVRAQNESKRRDSNPGMKKLGDVGVKSETLDEISDICDSISKATSTLKKSELAYELVALRAKAKKETLLDFISRKDNLNILNTISEDKIPKDRVHIVRELSAMNEKINEDVKSFLPKFENIHLMSFNEYRDLSLNERYDYIKHLGDSVSKIDSETETLLRKHKMDLLKTVSSELGMDRFLSAALGE